MTASRIHRLTLGRLRRALVRAMLVAFAGCVALMLACIGIHHLVGGAIAGLDQLLGSAWAARSIVGAACLVCAAALLFGPLWRMRIGRIARLRAAIGAVDPVRA